MKICMIIAAGTLAGGFLTLGPAAQADQTVYRRLHEGRSVHRHDPLFDNSGRSVPVRPGPPCSGLCNIIQIAAGNCHYPSH